MKRFDLQDNYSKPIALALGFFDCIHIGHEKLLRETIDIANKQNIESAVLTFSNDPNEYLNKQKQIYSFGDRASVLQNIGVDILISQTFDKDFMSLEPCEFLDILTHSFNIKYIVVGNDYTFGRYAKGNVEYMQSYLKDKDIKIIIVPFELLEGKKLSTRNLKSFITSGNVSELNNLLSEPYFVKGCISHERHVGSKIGYPTANIIPNMDRLMLASGIYATTIEIDGVRYNSMTNVGIKPTFDDNSLSIETHIFDFAGDIYGKTVIVRFISKVRDIVKFDSIDALKSQLQKDELTIRKILYR